MSHFAFVNPGGPLVPDLAKAKRYGITRLYWQANDHQLSSGLLSDVAQTFEVGIMRDPSWTGATAVDLARECDADLARLRRGGFGVQCAVMVDVEFPHHDPGYLLDFLHEWRALRPWRDTQWTPEFHQGGWFGPTLVQAINADLNFTVIPQAYIGDPPIVQDADLARCDITTRGVKRDRVLVYYLPGDVMHRESWDGVIFDLAKLA